uniref:NAC1 protein n=1 Tax=Carica papaya TaxID=3649 RepID=A0A1L2DX18_CARPA|nr:NAC1 protein [Carica papaya]
MGDGSMNLPPGFQFCPTDEELITHFLYRKASRLPCHPNIPHLHFYRSDPSHLQGKAVVSGNRYYFFTQVGSKEINGGKTENGYWKAVDEEEEEEEEGEAIFSRGNKLLIGTKKHLVFFLGQPPSAIQTNWFMEQYHLPTSNITSSERKKWVLCRVHDGGEGNSQGFSHSSSGDNDEDGIELSCLDEMFFSLHDDLEDVTSPN